ncbi:MAG: nickel-dependent lactate racemase, partial [Candidatus Bipolaricaulota bacterium]
MKACLRFGNGGIVKQVPDEKLSWIAQPKQKRPLSDPWATITSALNDPISSPSLEALIGQTETSPEMVITVEDHTRPVPNEVLIPPLLDYLIKAGVPEENITLLVATGTHRSLNREESEEFRKVVGQRVRIVNHRSTDEGQLCQAGRLQFADIDTDLQINREAIEADLLILTGDIELHLLYGYGGGAKSVLPAIADQETIRQNHSMLDLPSAHSGQLDNPLRNAAERAADMVGVDFLLSCVLNEDKELIDVFAGNVHEAFLSGVELVDELYKVPVSERPDLVLVSPGGYPKDINLYQSQKAVQNTLDVVRPGGKVVLFAECRDGWGSENFRSWIEECTELEEVKERAQT